MSGYHPLTVNDYYLEKYNKMSYKELKKEFPAVVDLIPKVTRNELLSFATKEWIPNYDFIKIQVDRWNEYNSLSDMGKDLMNDLYINQKGYATSSSHPLEKYILAYDHNIDSDPMLVKIADTLHLTIPEHESASEILYFKLKNYENIYPDYKEDTSLFNTWNK